MISLTHFCLIKFWNTERALIHQINLMKTSCQNLKSPNVKNKSTHQWLWNIFALSANLFGIAFLIVVIFFNTVVCDLGNSLKHSWVILKCIYCSSSSKQSSVKRIHQKPNSCIPAKVESIDHTFFRFIFHVFLLLLISIVVFTVAIFSKLIFDKFLQTNLTVWR